MTSVFGHQYFTRYHTLEGEAFQDAYTALFEIWNTPCGGEASEDNFILKSVGGPIWLGFGSDYTRQQYGEDAAFISMPKLGAEDRNIANCVYLAVNPDSSRRDEARAYLAALAAYLSRSEELPFFKDWQGEGVLDKTMHKTYENGEIGFAVDYDIYGEGFDELFSGTMTLSEYIKRTEQKLEMYWGE